MNIRKNIDYSAMFAALEAALSAELPQMQLCCELGRIVCSRPEKGAAVAAAEYLHSRFPDASGFSPRNLRRMREFYRMYEDTPELLALAMEISWTQNVVILEADMELEERRWYLRAAGRFGWSKAELQRKIDSDAHLEIQLDESEVPCYTECDSNELECTEHDQDTFSLPWEYLQKPDGRVYHEGSGEESRAGGPFFHRLRCHQHGGDRQSGLSTCPPQTGRARHQLRRQDGPADDPPGLRRL